MVDRTYDVVVSGAGPGGSATAAFLAREGLRVALLDKARFPRDKPCGDAISGKSVRVLQELGIVEWVEAEAHALANGVRFSSPAGDEVVIKFPADPGVHPGYVSRREVFDNVVFQAAKKAGADVFEQAEVADVLFDQGRAVGVRTKGGDVFRGRVVVGADGAMSPVARGVGAYDRDPRHWVAAIRVYYEGVTGVDDNIEIHFADPVLPGYFWIFPLDHGVANVGVGMLESEIKKRGRDMKADLQY
ncbi:MAG: NAD(P)/FAD-dependent oxidoreductase, partial [bacterium]